MGMGEFGFPGWHSFFQINDPQLHISTTAEVTGMTHTGNLRRPLLETSVSPLRTPGYTHPPIPVTFLPFPSNSSLNYPLVETYGFAGILLPPPFLSPGTTETPLGPSENPPIHLFPRASPKPSRTTARRTSPLLPLNRPKNPPHLLSPIPSPINFVTTDTPPLSSGPH